MKKIFLTVLIFFMVGMTSAVIVLSTIGIETSKFNNFISQKINQINKQINLELISVKFKIDIKELSLFLGTKNPNLKYRDVDIPTKNIKVYFDFLSFLKSEPEIKKVIVMQQINIDQLKKLSVSSKPSNITSFVSNKIKKGKIDIEIEAYFIDNILDNFIARGSVSNFQANFLKEFVLKKSSFKFFADKTDILIKNFSGDTEAFKISDGDLKLKLSTTISAETNFTTNFNNTSKLENFSKLFKNIGNLENISNLNANFKNYLKIDFDKTYKVENYVYKNTGKISSLIFYLKNPIENTFLSEKIKEFSLVNSNIESIFKPKQKIINLLGKYSFNKSNLNQIELNGNFQKEFLKLKFNVDYDEALNFDLINYKKPRKVISKIFVDFEKKNKNSKIVQLNYLEGKSKIDLKNVKFQNQILNSFGKISVKTFNGAKKNNEFSILFKDKIFIKGKNFDANNLPKFLKIDKKDNAFSKINKDIEIDLTSINAPLSEELKNFKLIGKIKKGNFVKISSKGDFGNNNFLDITMKNEKNKKYLEIYSDVTKPLLTEFSFFKGLTDGKLLFSSVIENDFSSSKLKIENFKVVNAPGMVKLLSLADLGGLADLAEGEGLSFDILEISMERNKNILKINEIVALGPSISVLMEGYQDKSVTSLRGTLVPAKTLNKMISKIPVIGDIVIPKELGEGLFGISFKMKGPPGKIKTTINPIRTLTPRFIQKIVDRKKQTK